MAQESDIPRCPRSPLIPLSPSRGERVGVRGNLARLALSPPLPQAGEVRSMGRPWGRPVCLYGVFSAFAGADADGFVERRDEDLAVTDLAGLGRGRDGGDHVADHRVLDGDLD